ncbi:hypothetical protein I4U23_023013 [Adineta vaga]|nr:hypothetical protein I4U23_023013 [Adineta vaga]
MVQSTTVYWLSIIMAIIVFANTQTTILTTTVNCGCGAPINACEAVKIALDTLRISSQAFKLAVNEANKELAEAAKEDPENAAVYQEIAKVNLEAQRLAAQELRAAALITRKACDDTVCCHSCCDAMNENVDEIFNPDAPLFNVTIIKAIPAGC